MYSLDKFIGYKVEERFVYFSGMHSLENYEKNLLSQEKDWYYSDKTITYERNELGHRSKPINQLDLDNYLLFTGCSYTEGIANLLEDTYPYLVSQKNNIDYYNLGLGGTGIDAMFFNLVQWISHIPKKPKALIVQWPNLARFLSFHRSYFDEAITNKAGGNFEEVYRAMRHKEIILDSQGIWSRLDDVERFLVLGESPNVNYFSSRRYLINVMIRSLFKDITVINISLGDKDLEYDLEFPALDNGCDLSHPGPKSNQVLSEKLSQLLKSKGVL